MGIDSNMNRWHNQQAEIDGIDHKVNELTTTVANNKTAIESTVNTNKTAIESTVNANKLDIEGKLNTFKSETTTNLSDIHDDLAFQISYNEADIENKVTNLTNDTATKFASNTTQHTTINNTINANKQSTDTAISTINSTLNSHTQNISNLETNLSNQITKETNDYNTLNATCVSLTNQTTSLRTDVNNNTNTIISNTSNINLLQSTVNSLSAPTPFGYIRYIREKNTGFTLNGVMNNKSAWQEIKAITIDNTNVALNKKAYCNFNLNSAGTVGLTDGDITNISYTDTFVADKVVLIDLGQVYTNIKEIIIYRIPSYDTNTTIYKNILLEVSEDMINWFTVYDSNVDGEYVEPTNGKTYTINTTKMLSFSRQRNVINEDMYFCYTLDKILTPNYSGASIKVWKDVNGTITEQDIGFVSNRLDISAIETFATVSGTKYNVFIRTKYNKSGNGIHATQTVNASCPKIYDATTGICLTENNVPGEFYDGVDDYLVIPNFDFTFNRGVSALSYFKITGSNNWQRIFDIGKGMSNCNFFLTKSGNYWAMSFAQYNLTSNNNVGTMSDTLAQNQADVFSATIDISGNYIYKNGNLLNFNAFTGILPLNTNLTSNFIGKSNWSADGLFKGYMSDVILFKNSLSHEKMKYYSNVLLSQRKLNYLYSPDGSRFSLNVANDGTLTATKITT
jgi:hypothetical protein